MGKKLAQGSSEYLVILSIILVILLGAVVLITALLPTINSTREQQIREYWNNVATPFALVEWSEDEPGGAGAVTYNLSLIVENKEDNEKNLTMIKIDGNDTAITKVDGAAWASWPVPFDRGQQRTIVLNLTGCSYHESPGHQHTVSLYYDKIRGLAGLAEIGREPLLFYYESNVTTCGD